VLRKEREARQAKKKSGDGGCPTEPPGLSQKRVDSALVEGKRDAGRGPRGSHISLGRKKRKERRDGEAQRKRESGGDLSEGWVACCRKVPTEGGKTVTEGERTQIVTWRNKRKAGKKGDHNSREARKKGGKARRVLIRRIT